MILVKQPCLLHKHYMITLPSYYDLSASDKLNITRVSIDYLFKFLGANNFRKILKDISKDTSVINAQKTLITKGNITKNLKLHLLQRCVGETPEKIGESSKIFVKLTQDQISSLTKLARTAILSKKDLDNLLLSCLENCRIYTIKFVKKKMTFLIKSGGPHELEAICNTLLLEGLQALLFTYPRFSDELHATNIMKATIKNVGMNYIETHTRKKRNSYESSNIIKVTSLDSSLESEILGLSVNDPDTYLQEEIGEKISKYTGRKAVIVKLLMGEYDEKFSDYLVERNITKYSNDLYFEHAKMDRYIPLIFEYLNYDKDKGYAFIEKLKSNLGDYK